MSSGILRSSEQAPPSEAARSAFEAMVAASVNDAPLAFQPQPQPSPPSGSSVFDGLREVPREALIAAAVGLGLIAAGLGLAIARRAAAFREGVAPAEEPETLLSEEELQEVSPAQEEPFEERITQEIPRAAIEEMLQPRELFTGAAAIFANLSADDLWTQVAARSAQFLALPEGEQRRILGRAGPHATAIVDSVLMPLRWAARREAEDHLRFRLSQDPAFEELSEARQQEVLRSALALLDQPPQQGVADGRGGLKPRWLDRVFKINAGFSREDLLADRIRVMQEFIKYPREWLRRWGGEMARRWDAKPYLARSAAHLDDLHERRLVEGREVHVPRTFSDGRVLNDVERSPRALPVAAASVNLSEPPDSWLRDELSMQLEEERAWDAAFREGDISGGKALRAHEIHRQLWREQGWFREALPEHRFQIAARIAAWSQEPVFQQHYIAADGRVKPEGLRIVGESISRYADRLSGAKVSATFPEERERVELPRPRGFAGRSGK